MYLQCPVTQTGPPLTGETAGIFRTVRVRDRRARHEGPHHTGNSSSGFASIRIKFTP